MRVWEFLKKIWPVCTVIFGILGPLGIGFGMYTYYHPNNQDPIIIINQKDDFNLFKLNDTIESLNVLYKGQDIRKQKLNLRVFKLRLSNEGKTDLTPVQYDKNVPFGILVQNGIVIAVDSLGCTDDLWGELRPTFKDSTKILFNTNVVIKKNDFLDFKIIVLYKNNVVPTLRKIGKIGNADFQFANGNLAARSDLYNFLVFIVILIVGAFSFILGINGIRELGFLIIRLVRKMYIKKCLNLDSDSTEVEKAMVKIYSITGKKRFLKFMNILKDNIQLNNRLQQEKEDIKVLSRYNELFHNKAKTTDPNSLFNAQYKSIFFKVIGILEKSNLITGSSSENRVIEESFLNEIEATVSAVK